MKQIIFALLILFLFPSFASAQANDDFLPSEYVITDFYSDIEIKKDASILIKEAIAVNFPYQKHGIFRVIPVTYSIRGKTLNTKLKVISITDENGNSWPYEKSRVGQSVSLKIGDPDKYVEGLQNYLITYRVERVIQRYDTHDELYWNITGSEWDTDIARSGALVRSDFAKIKNGDCFAGPVGTQNKECETNWSEDQSEFHSSVRLGYGQDFTVVVALEKDNELVFPGKLKNISYAVSDNWGYVAALIPFIILAYFWLKKGRDKRYLSDNIYYQPDDTTEITKPLFAREFLPTVYHPIQGLTPSQAGTIVDEKVDIHDIVAEIVELARLGFIKIEKIEKNKLFGKDVDYAFTRLQKDSVKLNDYQEFLLEKLFEDASTESATLKELEKLYSKDENKLKKHLKLVTEENFVLLSSLKNNFYTHLEGFRKRLYESLEIKGVFDGNPDKVRLKWTGYFIGMDIASAFALFRFLESTGNFFPLIVLGLFSVPSFFLALNMPRKTAKGYSLYRQLEGLAFYLKKGKWRHEISEKHLFFEEILPLAISLEVVDKLAKDMQDLEVKPPTYFTGTTTGSLSADLSSFESRASTNLASTPGGKGSSSWSGGSGFSGGSSGGGFGGGGGGSW